LLNNLLAFVYLFLRKLFTKTNCTVPPPGGIFFMDYLSHCILGKKHYEKINPVSRCGVYQRSVVSPGREKTTSAATTSHGY
jgi:hypothetical protein